MILTKSMFLDFLDCPGYCWLGVNNPDEAAKFSPDPEIDWSPVGSQVEALAQRLFPDGELVVGRGRGAAEATAKYLRKGSPAIFQATVITTSNLLAMADILVRDGDGWILYEVKSRTEVDSKTHVPDLAFQRLTFREAGFKIKQVRLLHINKQYVSDGDEVDPREFFIRDADGDWGINLTTAVRQYPELKSQTRRAQQELGSANPAACSCRLKTKTNHCPAFRYFWPEIPDPSIYDIARMTSKKISQLLDHNILTIDQAAKASQTVGFTDRQLAQIDLYPDRERVQWARIGHEFARLDWPLYFFDYETFGTAIPVLAGANPYTHIPFLYSLLQLADPESEPTVVARHLVSDQQPALFRQLADSLVGHLGATRGSIVVWHAQFERMANNTLARIYPDLKASFEALNQRLYDLEAVFAQGLYQNGRFNGRTSVKVVTKHLVPELDYQTGDLTIQAGDEASWRWLSATRPGVDPEGQRQAFRSLEDYCQRDTLVMVRIYQYLASGGKIRRGALKAVGKANTKPGL